MNDVSRTVDGDRTEIIVLSESQKPFLLLYFVRCEEYIFLPRTTETDIDDFELYYNLLFGIPKPQVGYEKRIFSRHYIKCTQSINTRPRYSTDRGRKLFTFVIHIGRVRKKNKKIKIIKISKN